MRIAALSDIHGNLAALDAVLDDIRRQGVDLIVNLGDIASGPLQPSETVDRLMALHLPTIRGNHERQLLEGDPSRMGPSDQYAFAALRPDQLAWFAVLPERRYIEDDVLLVHGSADSDLTYFLETFSEQGCRPATHDEVLARAIGADAKLVLCGHTHLPRTMKLTDDRFIVNPGSVGLQAYQRLHPTVHAIETGSPHARYAIVTQQADGWIAEFRAVEYAWDEAAALAEQRGRADWAVALRTGRVGA
ncbi:metallophosphoesterase family protein [Ralstonia solanacearum]|uniref:Putative Serine/threonine protein phosphatase n=1 Tax=Ralstonia solanacearum CFBP2957 TaxID=859656 RepID=D8P766_RALSL|nr:metallophosphoesterase family protein [Ralstonia solanacearum]CBJ52900.1 putative Serine/threonine protein phosphatase [Ralstonia solanacearum CFBP2957]